MTRKARLRAAAAKYAEAISEETRESGGSASTSTSSNSSNSSSTSNIGGGGGRTAGPQALNNLGLVLQELSSFEPSGSAARAALAAAAAARFRAAARSRPDFERAVYNLGTVLYASAPPASASSAAPSSTPQQNPSPSSHPPPFGQQQPPISRAEALADAAQCVALAAALRPAAPVYARSLALVQPFLPLPGKLRAGWLLVPDPLPFGSCSPFSSSSSPSSSEQKLQQQLQQNQGGSSAFSFLPGSVTLVGGGGGNKSSSAHLPLVFPSLRERFVARWCVIDAESLRAVTPPPADAPALPRGWEKEENGVNGSREDGHHQHGNGNNASSSFSHQHHHHHHSPHHHSVSRPLRVALSDVLSATPAADASLPGPAGAGIHIRFADGASFSSSSSSSSSSFVAPPAGCFFVAPSHAAAEAWADALCVAGHVARTTSSSSSRGGGGPLARVLTPVVGAVASSGAGVVGRRPSSSGLGR